MNKQAKNDIIDVSVQLATGVGAGMASNGLVGLIPGDDSTTKMIVRGATALAAAYGSTMVKGKTMGKKALTGGLIGIAIEQGKQLITDLMKESGAIKPADENSSAGDKFIANTFGLGCGCQGNTPTYPQVRMPSLNKPSYNGSTLINRQRQSVSTEAFN